MSVPSDKIVWVRDRADAITLRIGTIFSTIIWRWDTAARGPVHETFYWGSAVKEERRILIVDDDRDSTHLLKILLEKTGGYVVLEENDAVKAHQSAHNFRPDLILPDIMMPWKDGGAVARQIDANPQLPENAPIIFLTGLVTKSEARAGLRIQGYPVLAKPINIPDLINRLEENLPAP
jgi:CheY-like chemotaxis protein